MTDSGAAGWRQGTRDLSLSDATSCGSCEGGREGGRERVLKLITTNSQSFNKEHFENRLSFFRGQ